MTEVNSDLPDIDRTHPNSSKPTARQLEVLQLLANGLRRAEVGKELNIGIPTVSTHLKKANKKLDANNRTHAVAIVLRKGWIDYPEQ